MPKLLAALYKDLRKRGGIEAVEGFIDGTYHYLISLRPGKRSKGRRQAGQCPTQRSRTWATALRKSFQVHRFFEFRGGKILHVEGDEGVHQGNHR